jgi:lysozyme family protein
MTNIAALKDANSRRWSAMQISPSREASLEKTAQHLVANKNRYLKVQQGIQEQGMYVPWWFVAITHIRESDGDFNTQLAQGDPLDRVSTHVPAGRGPFTDHPGEKYDAFTRGCFDALIDCAPHAAKNTDWSVGGVLTLFEEYNGLGYANKGAPSPYVWSGTDQYSRGKYVADGVFDPAAVDMQPGCAALLSLMIKLDPTITFGIPTKGTTMDTAPVTPIATPTTTPKTTPSVAVSFGSVIKAIWTQDWTGALAGTAMAGGGLIALLPQISDALGSPIAQKIEASLGLTPYMGLITLLFGALTYLAKGKTA